MSIGMDSADLPSGWALADLGSYTDVLGGSTPSRNQPHYFGGNIVWLTPTEIPKESVTVLADSRERLTRQGFDAGGVRWIPAGSVLLTSRASIGYVAIAGTRLTTNQGFASFVVPDGIEPKYLGWWFKSQKRHLEELAGGTTFKEISKATLKTLFVPIAPTAEQRRIVEAIEQQFTRLDAGVAALKRVQAALKRYRAAVLKAAVEGKLTTAWRAEHPNIEPASDLLQRILAERRAKWEADMRAKDKDPANIRYDVPEAPDAANLPELPEGWCWATTDQISESIVDCPHTTPKFQHSGYLCIDTNCIKPGQIIFERARYVDRQTYAERTSRMIPQKDDVMFSREGTIGVAVKIPANIELCLGQRMMLFRPASCVLASYLESSLNSPVFREQYVPAITGTTSPHVNIRDIRAFAVPLPPVIEQEQIVAEVEERLSIVSELEATIEANLKRAARLRQSILERAFVGKLVPQCPNDEPASVLLGRIREQREDSHSRLPGKRNAVQENGTHQSASDDTETAKTIQTQLW